jgi:hypothetical protein
MRRLLPPNARSWYLPALPSQGRNVRGEGGPTGKERRKDSRIKLNLPVRVVARDGDGSVWEEMTACEDVSGGGACLMLKRPVHLGQALHLSLPLPKRFRRYDINESSYRVYGLVRFVERFPTVFRVGIMFLGKHPPRGADAIPAGRFLLPNDRLPERRQFERVGVLLKLKLQTAHAPGGVAREERTLAENLGKWGAQVKTQLPVAKGEMVVVEEVDGDYQTRAEIRNVFIGPDGIVRLNLLFLDGAVPERLLPADKDNASG